jgi:hypothetical protein
VAQAAVASLEPRRMAVPPHAGFLARSVDRHRQIVFAIRPLVPEGDVLNLAVAEVVVPAALLEVVGAWLEEGCCAS